MKNVVWYLWALTLLILAACGSEQESTTTDSEGFAGPVSDALPGESLEEVGLKASGQGSRTVLR